MSTSPSAPRRLGLILAIGCSSAAALIFEIARVGINGATSVISAIGSALLALTFGLAFVMACGAVCYGLVALLVNGTKRTSPKLRAVN